jgi:OOP family OmpA-OmpF porin
LNKPFYILSFVLVLQLLHSSFLCAQTNLVYNGNFEIYDSCPTGPSGPWDLQIETCSGWTTASWGTSDYFNSCSNNSTYQPVGVPSNAVGYQNAYNGNGYSGGFFYLISDATNGHYREYIQGSIVNTLEPGKKYTFGLRLSLASYSAMSIKNIGVVFSNVKIQQPDSWKPLPLIPNLTITASSFYGDTLNWVKLSGSFVANGTENYLTIGNFTDTLISDTSRVIPFDSQSPDFASYYYIDDVSLVENIDTISSSPPIDIEIPNVFTPNNDGVNDIFRIAGLKKGDDVHIYNRWGILVAEIDEPDEVWDGRTINGVVCSNGVYFYIISSANPKIKENSKKGFIQLVR